MSLTTIWPPLDSKAPPVSQDLFSAQVRLKDLPGTVLDQLLTNFNGLQSATDILMAADFVAGNPEQRRRLDYLSENEGQFSADNSTLVSCLGRQMVHRISRLVEHAVDCGCKAEDLSGLHSEGREDDMERLNDIADLLQDPLRREIPYRLRLRQDETVLSLDHIPQHKALKFRELLGISLEEIAETSSMAETGLCLKAHATLNTLTKQNEEKHRRLKWLDLSLRRRIIRDNAQLKALKSKLSGLPGSRIYAYQVASGLDSLLSGKTRPAESAVSLATSISHLKVPEVLDTPADWWWHVLLPVRNTMQMLTSSLVNSPARITDDDPEAIRQEKLENLTFLGKFLDWVARQDLSASVRKSPMTLGDQACQIEESLSRLLEARGRIDDGLTPRPGIAASLSTGIEAAMSGVMGSTSGLCYPGASMDASACEMWVAEFLTAPVSVAMTRAVESRKAVYEKGADAVLEMGSFARDMDSAHHALQLALEDLSRAEQCLGHHLQSELLKCLQKFRREDVGAFLFELRAQPWPHQHFAERARRLCEEWH